MADVYERLREKLDGLAKGFPATESGYELEYVKGYFTPEEAELFNAMPDGFQTPGEFAAVSGDDPGVIAEKMAEMAKKGLLFRVHDDGVTRYRTIPVIHGIMEFHIEDFDSEKMRKFVTRLSAKGLTKSLGETKIPFYRTVPVKADLVLDSKILPFDDAIALVKGKNTVAVADCVCRKSMELLGKPCSASGNRMETCLCFDSWADYYVENGLGRYITKDEALRILERNDQDGLVTQIANSVDAEIMCSCCACCCGFMASLKYFKAPCREFNSNYVCEYDESICIACGKCAERCSFEATKLVDEKIQYKVEKCLGCGLCVSTCPSGARTLVRKPDEKVYQPPKTLFDAYDEMAAYRKQEKG
ncbi:MAG: 4Fe-4S binding protein [Firmicutes bacterium]|nr:4Fe-4S binding protein [Bacillota bacterium]